jgi:glycosyltransferase involved in cell wall biosynthesis
MRLLFLLPEYLPQQEGGIVTFYRTILPKLAEAGHDVRVVVGSGVTCAKDRQAQTIDGVQVEVLDEALFRHHWERFAHFDGLASLRRFMAGAWAVWEQAGRGEGADLIEASDWGFLFLPPVLESRCPVIAQLHASNGQVDLNDGPVRGMEACVHVERLLEAVGLSRADGLQTSSHANAEFWRRQTNRPVACIRPGWVPLPVSEGVVEMGSGGLIVGRVQRWKGPHVLCEAVRILGDRAPAIEWVGRDVTASGSTVSTSGMLAASFPGIWGNLVVHRPQAPINEIARLQRAARFVVVPSTWDVFNFTCVEAMAAGRPVICSDGAGASELIEDGRNCFVFESGNARSLASAIERVLSLSSAESAKIGSAGRDTVMTALDPDMIVAQRLAAYEDALRNFTGRAAEPGDFLYEACKGRADAPSALAHLDHVPLRAILRYSGRRLLTKLSTAQFNV